MKEQPVTKSFWRKRAAGIKKTGEDLLDVKRNRENIHWIKRLITWFKPKKLDLSKESVDFETAMMKSGIQKEEELLLIYRNLMLKFWISACLFLVGLIISLGGLWYGNIKPLIGFVGFGALCLSLMFQCSFVGYQVRKKKSIKFEEWKENPGEWLVIPVKKLGLK